jgi:hypothetical protein
MVISRTIYPHPPFDYGSGVRVAASVAADYSFTVGSVYGFERIETAQRAAATNFPIGTVLLSVEDPSGASHIVPAEHLEILND